MADPRPQAGNAAAKIGWVEKATGQVQVVHSDGRTESLHKGDALLQGDQIKTGPASEVGMVFIDRSTFQLAAGGEMVLDELVFDPAAADNGDATALMTLRKGTFSLASGQIAHTHPGAQVIRTPTMSIGIRGTTVAGEVGADGSVTLALVPDRSGHVGEIQLTSSSGESTVINAAGNGVSGFSGGSFRVAAVDTGRFAPVVSALPPHEAAPPPSMQSVPVAPAPAPEAAPGAKPGDAGPGGGEPVAPPPPPPAADSPVLSPTGSATTATQTATSGTTTGTTTSTGGTSLFAGAGSGQTTTTTTTTTAAANSAPVNSGSVVLASGTEDTGVVITKASLLATTSDANGDVLTVGTVTADHGSVVDNGDGTVTLTPHANYSGPVTLSYTISDGRGGTASGGATLTVTAVADAPSLTVFNESTGTVIPNANFGQLVGLTDTDGSESLGLVTISGLPTNATLSSGTQVSPGTWQVPGADLATLTLTLPGGQHGQFTVTFSATSVEGANSDTATTTATLTLVVDDAPSISGVSGGSGAESTTGTATVVTGHITGSDPNGDAITYVVTDAAAPSHHGTLTVDAAGNFTYTASDPNWNGTDTFQVLAADQWLAGGMTPVTITVTPTNDAPTASAVPLASGNQDTAVTFAKTALLANSSDPDGDALSATGIAADHGTVVDNGDGTVTFTPSPSYSGPVTFSYTVDDNHGGTTAGSATMTLAPNTTVTVTSGPDALDGGVGNTTYAVAAGDFTAGDAITDSGGAGDTDTIAVTSAGTVDLSAGTVTGIEAITFQTGGATVVLGGGADPQQLKSIVGSAGIDTVRLADGSTSLNLAGVTLTGIETISTGAGSDSVILDDTNASGVGIIVDGDASGADSDSVTVRMTHGGTLNLSSVVTANIESVNAEVSGTSANVTLIGTNQNNTLIGGAGNDTLTGGIGADRLTGGTGSDVFTYTAAAQSQDAMSTRDTITDFATGTDHVRVALSGSHVDVSGFANVSSYNAGQATLTNGVIGDGFYASFDQALYFYISGTTTNIGSDGGYVIGSANTISAADLQFDITGTTANDILVGGAGDDTITGDSGDDTLSGGDGSNVIAGGTGTDTVSYATATSGVTVDLAAGTASHGAATDTLSGIESVTGSAYDDTLKTSALTLGTLSGGAGNDTYVLTAVPAANQTFSDSAGTTDTLTLAINGHTLDYAFRDIRWNGTDLEFVTVGGNTLTVSGIDFLNAAGWTSPDALVAAGAQTAGDDTVIGKAGDTALAGDGGSDTLIWVSGVTAVDGGAGSGDTADFRHSTVKVVADLGVGSTVVDGTSVTMTGIEDVVGGSGDDTLIGSAGTDNFLMGRDGNNDITGNAGDHDTVSYGDALSGVTVNLTAGTATHGAATDTLTNITGVMGSDFNDTIIGSALDDRLDGGLGTNILTGNAGADSFVAAKGGVAQITDFTSAQDNITLRDPDFGLGTTGTLAAANYAEDANAANAVTTTAHDYSGGVHNAGVVVINDGAGGADVWYTADLANASTANSQQIAHTNVDTSAIDNSAFHLAI